MNNTFVYLIGNAAPVRRAAAGEIAALTGARIVDAQAVYDPVFNVVPHDDVMAIPDAVWAQVDAVRAAVLTTIATLSPPDWSFVFTHAGFDIPADVGVYRTVRETAAKRAAKFAGVRLLGGKSKRPLLAFADGEGTDIDMTAMSPAEVARKIIAATG